MIAGLLFLCCATQAHAQATPQNRIFQADPSSKTPLKLSEAKMTAVSTRAGIKPGTKSNKLDMPYLSDDDVKGILSKAHRSTKVVKHFILTWSHQVARVGGGGTMSVIGRCVFSTSDEPRYYFWLNGISKKDSAYYTEYPQWIGVKYQGPLGGSPSKFKPASFLVVYNLLASDDVPSGGKPEVDGGICDSLFRGTSSAMKVGPNGHYYFVNLLDPSPTASMAVLGYGGHLGTVFVPRLDVYQISP